MQYSRRLAGYALMVMLAQGIGNSSAAPLGPAFTFQGRLSPQGGGPPPATVNLDFRLFDAATLGSQIGTEDKHNGVPLLNGLFTVTLNDGNPPEFGVNPFNGQAQWIEVRVNGTPLAPRQPVTAAPYASYSLAAKPGNSLNASDGSPTSAVFVDAAGNVGVGTTSPSRELEVAGAGDVEIGVRSTDTNGRLWTLQSSRVSGAATDGTFQIVDRTAGSSRMTIDTAGNVGIGTTAPEGALHVRTTTGSTLGRMVLTPGTSDAVSEFLLAENTTASRGIILRYEGAASNQLQIVGLNGDVESGSIATFDRDTNAVTVTGDLSVAGNLTGSSNLGIGTSQPAAPLHIDVSAVAGAQDLILAGPVDGEHLSVGAQGVSAWNATSPSVLLLNPDGSPEAGNVCIGTRDPVFDLVVQRDESKSPLQGNYRTTVGATLLYPTSLPVSEGLQQLQWLYMQAGNPGLGGADSGFFWGRGRPLLFGHTDDVNGGGLVERMRIREGGQVTIGNFAPSNLSFASPVADLTVQGFGYVDPQCTPAIQGMQFQSLSPLDGGGVSLGVLAREIGEIEKTGACFNTHGGVFLQAPDGFLPPRIVATSESRGLSIGSQNLAVSPSDYVEHLSISSSVFALRDGRRMHIEDDRDVALASTAPFTIGDPPFGENLAMDNNEIMARNNGQPARLSLNNEGGDVALIRNGVGGVSIAATPSATFKLVVGGEAAKPGGGFWAASSDARLKKNVERLSGALEKLLALRGVSFEYVDPTVHLGLPGEQVGLIAQEVEQVFPEWVSEDKEGYKYVTVRGLEALVVEALRELGEEGEVRDCELRGALEAQNAEIQSQRDSLRRERKENRLLRERLEQLEIRVAKIESGVDSTRAILAQPISATPSNRGVVFGQ